MFQMLHQFHTYVAFMCFVLFEESGGTKSDDGTTRSPWNGRSELGADGQGVLGPAIGVRRG
jgi:hypothetical protein